MPLVTQETDTKEQPLCNDEEVKKCLLSRQRWRKQQIALGKGIEPHRKYTTYLYGMGQCSRFSPGHFSGQADEIKVCPKPFSNTVKGIKGVLQ